MNAETRRTQRRAEVGQGNSSGGGWSAFQKLRESPRPPRLPLACQRSCCSNPWLKFRVVCISRSLTFAAGCLLAIYRSPLAIYRSLLATQVGVPPFFWPSTTILAGGPSAYGGGLGRPFSHLPTRFFFPPGFFRVSFWLKKWLNPFKNGPFWVSETVQKKFKKKLTLPCSFVIFVSHTVTTKQKYRKQYEN